MIGVEASAFRAELARLRGALVTAAERTVADAVGAAKASAIATKLFKDGPNARLRGSIDGKASSLEGKVVADTPYARFVNYGTAPHVIEGNPLAFRVGGSMVFARRVMHPGTKPRPFMEAAAAAGDKAMDSAAEKHANAAISTFNRAG